MRSNDGCADGWRRVRMGRDAGDKCASLVRGGCAATVRTSAERCWQHRRARMDREGGGGRREERGWRGSRGADGGGSWKGLLAICVLGLVSPNFRAAKPLPLPSRPLTCSSNRQSLINHFLSHNCTCRPRTWPVRRARFLVTIICAPQEVERRAQSFEHRQTIMPYVNGLGPYTLS